MTDSSWLQTGGIVIVLVIVIIGLLRLRRWWEAPATKNPRHPYQTDE